MRYSIPQKFSNSYRAEAPRECCSDATYKYNSPICEKTDRIDMGSKIDILFSLFNYYISINIFYVE